MMERWVRSTGEGWPMAQRSVLATVRGVGPGAAVVLAAVLTAVGVLLDLVRIGSLGAFTICYLVGCLLAAAWVRRDGLFWTLVQPPLLVAYTVPVGVLLAGSPKPGTGTPERLLMVGAPLVNAFPIMAWTTGLVLAVGLLRHIVQPPLETLPPTKSPSDGHEEDEKGKTEKAVSARRGPSPPADAARGAAKTSGSPRRS